MLLVDKNMNIHHLIIEIYRNLYSLPIKLEIKYLTPHLSLLYLYYFAFTSSENS